MQICRGCQRNIPESRFCPECGRDQTVVFPSTETIKTETQTQPPPSGESPAWVRGLGYSFGGCMFLSITGIVGFLGIIFLISACMVVGGAAGG
jgi:hypothetical protein